MTTADNSEDTSITDPALSIDVFTSTPNHAPLLSRAIYHRFSTYLNTTPGVGTLFFSYITEGAANIIWLVHFPSSSSLHGHDSSLVLRMRKDIPSIIPMIQLRQQFNGRIAPLFSHNTDLLVPVHLMKIDQDVINILNAQLRQLETSGQRKEMRRGVYLPPFQTEPFAIVMPNLAHGNGTLVEFKPKWLVQSPSAPENASRCRTCALNTMRRAKRQEAGKGDLGFCPFELLSSHNDELLARTSSKIWTTQKTLSAFVAVFKAKVQPALRHLQMLQLQENTVGLDDFQNPQGRDFSVAMALRDCSIMLKVIVAAENDSVDIVLLKFLDLDLKDAGGGKLEKWTQTELELLKGGWYTSQQQSNVSCALDRSDSNSSIR